jgi:hypothetical protein
MRKKKSEKKVYTLPNGPRGPLGGKALPPVLVVPEEGSVLNFTHKNERKKSGKKS